MMRAAFLGLVVSAIATHATAADYLRGSTYEAAPKRGYDWSGVYVGGQVGYANTDFDLGPATREMVANEVRELLVEQEFNISGLPNLPGRDGRAVSYGGFIGFNKQWGDIVLSFELNYNRTSISAESTDSIGRAMTASNDLTYNVLLDSRVSAELTDYASIRLRAGYAMDWLMPYMMFGASVGRVNYSRSVSINLQEWDMEADPDPVLLGTINRTVSDARNNALTGGFAIGGGVDLGLTRNLFLRAEYEYMYLAPVAGISFHVNTIRGAAALKF